VVDQIILPSQAGTLAYTFRYNASSENPPPDANGWGELGTITLPSGAKIDYRYQLDGQDNVFAETVVQNSPTRKDFTYLREYDGTATSVTETWQYTFGGAIGSSGSIVAPDGGVSSESFDGFAANLRANDGWRIGVSLQSDYPDGSKVERFWRPNTPFGSRDINPFIKTTFTSIKNAAGDYVLTAITDYNYDKNGNVTRVADYDWVSYGSVARDASGRPTGVIPAGAQLKKVTTNTYFNQTADASVVSSDPNAYIVTTSPRLRSALASSEVGDASQPLSRTELTYDNASTTGNLTEQKSWDSQKGGYSNPLTPSNSISVTNQYNPNVSGQLTQTTDARGFSTGYTYGLINGFSDLYPTETRRAAGTTVQRKETREYDFYIGVVTRVTDADNNVSTATTYDVFGRPTLVKAAEGKPDEETRTSTEYSDVNRRVIVRADLDLAGDGKIVSIQHYDQLGRVRLTRRLEQFSTAGLTDETVGIKVQTRYLINNPCQPTNAAQCLIDNNGVIASYVLTSNPYRAANSSAASTEPTMGWTRTKSDRTGRQVEVQTFAGATLPAPWSTNNSSTGTTTTGYDGRFITVTDQAGKVRRSKVDALGRLIRVDEPSDINNTLGSPDLPSQPTSYEYDALGNLKQLIQGSQNRSFNYTSLSRLKDSINPEGGTISYEYDANGNLTTRTDPRLLPNTSTHVSMVMDYDQLNRLKSRTYNDGTPTATYNYDDTNVLYSKGRLTSVSSSASSYSYGEYDPLGRVKTGTQTTAGQPYTMTYTYNRAGALVSQGYPSGRVVKAEYDEAGRLAGVKKDDASNFFYAGGGPSDPNRFQYSAAGAVQGMRLGNGLWEHTNFNSRLQVVQIGVGTSLSDSSKLRLDYTFGVLEGVNLNAARNNGNVQSQTITLPGVSAIVQKYEYDELNRLKMAQEVGANGWTEEFSYDRFGNRNGVTISQLSNHPLPTTAPEVDPNTNRFKLLNPQNQATGYDYDDAGNMTREPEAGGTFKKYSYDSDNRIKQAKRLAGATETVIADYVYDGDGKRVKSVVGAVTTIYVYNILGQLVAEYTDGPTQNGGTSYVTTDTLGSTRLITGSNQEAKERHDYLPFGEEVPSGYNSRANVPGYGTDNVRQKFTGKERDNETGLDYFWARHYSSARGRFVSVDPLMASAKTGNPQTWNRYVYLVNNPLRDVDPEGMDGKTAWDQLTKEEQEIIAPKLNRLELPAGGSQTRTETPEQAFNRMFTGQNAEETAALVTGVKNFIDGAGGHSNSEVWQQVGAIDGGWVEKDRNNNVGIFFRVDDSKKFLATLERNGYDVDRYYETVSGSDHRHSARQITQTSHLPGLHFVQENKYERNRFDAHWDRRSSAFRDTDPAYWTRQSEQMDAGRSHNSYYSPSELRQKLREQGIVPRNEP
jgi:RHS repeat-associated protein